MNATVNSKIQKQVIKVLQDNLADIVIGFEKANLPFISRPCFIKNEKDVEKLYFDSFCALNLACYLPKYKDKKIAIIARGCETRAINVLISENQINRKKIYIIGISCKAILDRKKINNKIAGNIIDVTENEEQVKVSTEKKDYTFNKKDLICDSCKNCTNKNPINADIIIGDNVLDDINTTNKFENIEKFEKLDSHKRNEFFINETSKCIRCYACRQACPMCYCTQCFVDSNQPKWCESIISDAGNQSYHITRAFHQTARCVSCGACERACPMDIKLLYLTDKLNKDIYNDFNKFEPGLNSTDNLSIGDIFANGKN